MGKLFQLARVLLFLIFLPETLSAEVKVALREPLKFKVVRAGSDYDGSIMAEGIIEIMAEEEDFGKGIKFDMPELSFMSNGKNWIKIDKLVFDKDRDKIIIDKNRTFVRFYGIIDPTALEKNSRRELLEGNYEGDVPLLYSVYRKK